MATTTVQYVTTDYLNNENFLKAANIKAGTNITVSTSGNNVTINSNAQAPLNYYHEIVSQDPSENAVSIIPPGCLNISTKSTYINGPLYLKVSDDESANRLVINEYSTFIGNKSVSNTEIKSETVNIIIGSQFVAGPSSTECISLSLNNGIELKSHTIFISGPTSISNVNSDLVAVPGQIQLNANSVYINGPLYIGTSFFAGPEKVTIFGEKPVLDVTSSDGSITINKSDYTLDLKGNGGSQLAYYNERSDEEPTYVTIGEPSGIRIQAKNTIYGVGPYVFIGAPDKINGICYDASGGGAGGHGMIGLNASTVFISGPTIEIGSDPTASLRIGHENNPVGDTKIFAHDLKLRSSGTVFLSGPTIRLNQPDTPGITVTNSFIEVSMTESSGSSSQQLGTTLKFTKENAKITTYSIGTGKELTFNTHSVDVLDKVVNKHFENLTRVDGIGGEGVWNKMKNNGVYYFLHGSRIDSDLDFRNENTGPAGGELAIDVASDGGDIGTVRTAELHVKHSKLAPGIMWPTSWQWVDEADPTIPPTIPDTADGKWVCFTIRTVVTPEDYTLTHITLSYIYG